MLSKEHFALLKILYVFRQRLGDISDEEAKREGYSCKAEYLIKFAAINKIPYDQLDLSMLVWVVGFEVMT
jgi:hypothetical protein